MVTSVTLSQVWVPSISPTAPSSQKGGGARTAGHIPAEISGENSPTGSGEAFSGPGMAGSGRADSGEEESDRDLELVGALRAYFLEGIRCVNNSV